MTDTASPRVPSGRIDDIECLRALAVAGVVIHHAHGNLITASPGWFDTFNKHFGFWSGVDLFFVISGFVIARTLLPEIRAAIAGGTTISVLLAFWVRRAFRLLPSAWAWLALILLAAAFYNASNIFGSLHANLWSTMAAIANVANFRFADAFMRYEYGASFVYWSLSLEEQFYLLLPLFALLLRRQLHWLMIAVIVAQAMLPVRGPLLMSIRTDALAWGVLLAIIHGSIPLRRLEPRFLNAAWVRLPIIGAIVVLLSLVSSDHWDLANGQRVSIVAVLGSVLVWIASYNRDYLCRGKAMKRLALWAGSRSYAIYLAHIPVFFAIREAAWRMGHDSAGSSPYSPAIYAVTAIMLICISAEATYRLVDAPFRQWGKTLAGRIRHRSARQAHAAAPIRPD